MAALKKNIWTIFFVITLMNTIGLALFSFVRWQNIEHTYDAKQVNLVNLVSNAAHSMLAEHEMILEIVGSELTKPPFDTQSIQYHPMLDKLMRLNPVIVGFGLATPDGEFVRLSSNTPLNKLPNLLKQAESRESFQKALNSDRMVLGRSYLMPAVNEWIIPIRKSIRNNEGEVIAVMTAGLGLKGAASLFNTSLSMDDDHVISLVKDQSYFILYRSRGNNVPSADFNQPVPAEQVARSHKQLEKRHGLSIDNIKKQQLTLPFQTSNSHYAVARYDNTFHFWTVSQFQHNLVHAEFISSVIYYLLAFIVIQGVLYWLFRTIHASEQIKNQALVHQAMHDPLTRLPNRNYLLRKQVDWIREDSLGFCLMFIDLDRFKNLNDSMGHEFGDQALQMVADRIRNNITKDTAAIRQGGDEFILLIHETHPDQLLRTAQHISKILSSPYKLNGISFDLGCSIGIARYPKDGSTLDDLLRGADIAMYEAKKHRNSVRFFERAMLLEQQRKIEIERYLLHGLENNEFFMVYQPQVNQNGKLYGVEALIRWQSQTLGFVPPDQFITIAESSGLMPRLGLFVLQTAMQEVRTIQSEINENFHLSINISVKQFMQANFIESLEQVVQATGIDKLSIVLEITESLFIDDIGYIYPLLERIRALGMKVSIDDFGTGYSSLSMLASLPIDELKIDKSFVDNIIDDSAARKMIQNIIAIGKNYNMTVLAEGVESQEQASLLREFGCDRFQGYFFAKPLSQLDLKEFALGTRESIG